MSPVPLGIGTIRCTFRLGKVWPAAERAVAVDMLQRGTNKVFMVP
jgi:hypothetical protein